MTTKPCIIYDLKIVNHVVKIWNCQNMRQKCLLLNSKLCEIDFLLTLHIVIILWTNRKNMHTNLSPNYYEPFKIVSSGRSRLEDYSTGKHTENNRIHTPWSWRGWWSVFITLRESVVCSDYNSHRDSNLITNVLNNIILIQNNNNSCGLYIHL